MIESINIKGFTGFPIDGNGVTASFEGGKIQFLHRNFGFRYRSLFMKTLSYVKSLVTPVFKSGEVHLCYNNTDVEVELVFIVNGNRFRYVNKFDNRGILFESLSVITNSCSNELFRVKFNPKKDCIELCNIDCKISENLEFVLSSNLKRNLSLFYVIRQINYNFGLISDASYWFNTLHTDLIDTCLKNGGHQLYGAYYNSNADTYCDFEFVNKFLRYTLRDNSVTLNFYTENVSVLTKGAYCFAIEPNSLSSEELHLIDLALYLSKIVSDDGLFLVDDFDKVLSDTTRKKVL